MKTDLLTIRSYGQGQELILIHGFGWDGTIWQTILPELCLTHRVHVVDLPETLTDLAALCDAIITECPNPATWLGWSTGGLIALHAALHYPTQIEKLILVASSPHFVKKNNWPGITLEALKQLDNHFQDNKVQAIKKFIRLQTNGNYALTQKLMALSNPSNYETSDFTLLKNTDFTHALGDIDCPILGIFGKHDRLVPVEISTLLKSYMTVQLFDTAHLPFYEMPALFVQSILEFTQYAA